MEITENKAMELLNKLARNHKPNLVDIRTGGVTVNEMAEAWGVSHKIARKQLDELVNKGILEAKKQLIPRVGKGWVYYEKNTGRDLDPDLKTSDE